MPSRAGVIELLLTARTAISHHDPAVRDDSNRNLFNRQKQELPALPVGLMPSQAQIDALAAANPVPGDVAELMQDVTLPQFVATALLKLFMDLYNSEDGTGLFAGMERYSRLEARARQSAISSPILRSWWNRLVDTMNVGIHGGDHDGQLLQLLSVPMGLQQASLRVLSDDYRTVVSLARYWHTRQKCQSPEYAEKTKQPVAPPSVVQRWDADSLETPASSHRIAEVPQVTGNALRHQVVREPAWVHLWQTLGIEPSWPGQGPFPAPVDALFINGNNILSGASQPSNAHRLAWRVRELYPSLDLLGGCTDSFTLGESRVAVAGWLVCAENREALRGTAAYDLPNAHISLFDRLDDVTLTHQATRDGIGQMIFSFESLCMGTQILCQLVLDPDTPYLTQGALAAAVSTYINGAPNVGGQAARGFGWMRGEALSIPDNWEQARYDYEAYLRENREALLQGMADGTMGTGARILSDKGDLNEDEAKKKGKVKKTEQDALLLED